jgi:hypothetical protein
MSDEIELLPCPFCGHEPVKSSKSENVTCICYDPNKFKWISVETWNTRNNDAHLKALIEKAIRDAGTCPSGKVTMPMAQIHLETATWLKEQLNK